MSNQIRVIPEELQVSAATVDAHADAVRSRHADADGQIESAQRGLPAASSAALSTAVTKWQEVSTALFGKMVDHSNGLRAGASGYTQTDQDKAAQIEAAGEHMSDLDLGL